jgi:hypothetical protein
MVLIQVRPDLRTPNVSDSHGRTVQAAIDNNQFSRDVAGLTGTKERDHACDFFRRAVTCRQRRPVR